jgi:20S proteasome alpha/beta subunit
MSSPRIQILPKRPVKTYIRPDTREGKALTIAAGFRCNEGIVLCADRLITHGGPNDADSFAHYETKVFAIENHSNFSAIACGAGNASLIRPIAESFLAELKNCLQPPELRMSLCKSILEGVLNDFSSKLADIPKVQLLIAANDEKGQQQFLLSDGLIVHPANDIEIWGIGETSAVRYLIDSIYKKDMDLSELATLAALVVYVAKKYCPQYCGGDTDVYMISKKYEFFVDPESLPRSVIQKFERDFAEKIPESLSTLINTLTFH